MSDEQLQESATSEPQTNAREQELLNRIEALDRKNKEILEEKRKFSKVEKTLQTLPDGVDVQALSSSISLSFAALRSRNCSSLF